MALAEQVHTNAEALRILRNPEISAGSAAFRLQYDQGIKTSERAVGRWRDKHPVGAIESPSTPPKESKSADSAPKTRLEEDANGITVYHDAYPVELGDDFGPLIKFFGYDPDKFDVVEDTVKVSKWQQSKGNDNGTRDIVWLYSYKARFVRKSSPLNPLEDVEEAVSRIRVARSNIKPKRRKFERDETPVVYVHQQGDEQIGKSEGGGLLGVIERTEASVGLSYERLHHLIEDGHNVVGIVDIANGDTVENIFGHYPSQARTTSTLRRQMKVGRDLDLFRTEAFAEFGLPITKIYCTDNHGEIRQKIGLSPFTSESDNLALILAESVKDVIDRSDMADDITWHIPHDEWWTLATVAGVNFAVGHGHKAVGKLDQWVQNQRDYLHMHRDFKADLMLLGHKHHFMTMDVSGTTVIQTPSLDGGSPFFAAMRGNVSKHGVVTYLAGPHLNQKFSDLTVL